MTKLKNGSAHRHIRAIVNGVAIGGIAIALLLLIASVFGMPITYATIARLSIISVILLLIVRRI